MTPQILGELSRLFDAESCRVTDPAERARLEGIAAELGARAGAYVQPAWTAFDRALPARGTRTRIREAGSGETRHALIERVSLDGQTQIAAVAIAPTEIEMVVDALRRVRGWILGAPQAAAPHAVLNAPKRGKRRC